MSNVELSPPPKVTGTTELSSSTKLETNSTPNVNVVCSLDQNSSTTFCKICLTGESSEQLLQPCLCKGNFK